MSEEDVPKTTRILDVGYMSEIEFDEVAFQYVMYKWGWGVTLDEQSAETYTEPKNEAIDNDTLDTN